MLISIFGAVLAILLVVFFHELGHFVAARLLKIKVLKFSIGFGPALWTHISKKTGIVYVIALIPLGGYVKMYGEEEPVVDGNPFLVDQAFSRKPVWARMIVSLAGPFANILLAVIMFSLINMLGVTTAKPIIGSVIANSIAAHANIQSGDQIMQIGLERVRGWEQVMTALMPHVGDRKPLLLVTLHDHNETRHYLNLSGWRIKDRNPDLISALGFVPYHLPLPPVIQSIVPKSPAELSGLRSGDLILKINHHSVSDWFDVVAMVHALPGKVVTLLIKRADTNCTIPVHLAVHHQADSKIGYLGAVVDVPPLAKAFTETTRYSFFAAFKPAVLRVGDLLALNCGMIKKMMLGKVSLDTLGGPISVFQTAGQASAAGFLVYAHFIGFLSVALGFINLLPIPLLDGGHVLFQIIEWVRRRPLSESQHLFVAKIGFFLLICLMLQATINDVLRFI